LLFRHTSWKRMCCPSGGPALFHASSDVCNGGVPGANCSVSSLSGHPAVRYTIAPARN
jgi:hypothetical protein